MSTPRVGERHDDGIGWVLEWTGDAWTPVCPTDDVAMTDRDERAVLRCGVCLVRVVDMEPRR